MNFYGFWNRVNLPLSKTSFISTWLVYTIGRSNTKKKTFLINIKQKTLHVTLYAEFWSSVSSITRGSTDCNQSVPDLGWKIRSSTKSDHHRKKTDPKMYIFSKNSSYNLWISFEKYFLEISFGPSMTSWSIRLHFTTSSSLFGHPEGLYLVSMGLGNLIYTITWSIWTLRPISSQMVILNSANQGSRDEFGPLSSILDEG